MRNRAAYKRSGSSDASIIRTHLQPAFGSVRLASIRVPEIESFRAGIARSPKTVSNILTLLCAMLNYAGDELGRGVTRAELARELVHNPQAHLGKAMG